MNEVIIHNKQVLAELKQKPAYIYHVWQPFSKRKLMDKELLPASIFKLLVK